MAERLIQERLSLGHSDPLSLNYFVCHSGVAEAFSVLDRFVDDVREDPSSSRIAFLWGPEGSGKTHLARGFAGRAIESGIEHAKLDCCEWDENSAGSGGEWQSVDRGPAEFISRFETIKRTGGLFFVTSRNSPDRASKDPHIQSRLLSGAVLKLSFPRDDELRPVLVSLLARHNLRLSDSTLNYLLERLPANPLCFDSVFAKISDLSYAERKPVGMRMLRQTLRETT